MRSARNHLLKAIHCYPSDSDLHDQLIALSIGSLQSNRESILRLSQSVTDVQDLVGLSSLAAGHIQEGLKWAQNAVHLYPGEPLISVALQMYPFAKCKFFQSVSCAAIL